MLARITALAAAHHLALLGGFAPDPDDAVPRGTRALLLLGPQEPGFWPHLTAQPEWQDGRSDPVDRWSRRVIGRMACDLGAKALFPFGGPPHHPFYQWALRSGRTHVSPVRLLVHQDAGLMVSFRGALALKDQLALPAPEPPPCTTCADQPCRSACPAGALTPAAYDVPACHSWLNRAEGAECLTRGCAVRRACPLSQAYARMEVQSAYHMGQFHR
jgi:epoxyqueuosine reductase